MSKVTIENGDFFRSIEEAWIEGKVFGKKAAINGIVEWLESGKKLIDCVAFMGYHPGSIPNYLKRLAEVLGREDELID